MARDNDWRLLAVEAAQFLNPLLEIKEQARPEIKRIMIDPGHGGEDLGAAHGVLQEKELTLKLAKLVQAGLVAAGCDVRLSRERDRTLTLRQRNVLTERWQADLLISLHFNKAPQNSKAEGAETYILSLPNLPSSNDPNQRNPDRVRYKGNQFNAENARLGYFLQHHLLARSAAKDRGLKRARFQVLRDASCPAALVECGFVSSKVESKRLQQPYYLRRLAAGIIEGISEYMGR